MIETRSGIPAGARRLVVKAGSAVLSGGGSGLSRPAVARLSGEAAAAVREGRQVVIVSSGAILAGRERLALKARPSTQLKQAAAAAGQSLLMRAWEEGLSPHGLAPAQVLLTAEDLRHRGRYLNARNTLLTLLRLGAVPVVNENDTVAVEEIRFGDNDALSSLVAGLVDADLLVLLTDQDGLYTEDPRRRPDARLVPLVRPGEAPSGAGRAGPWGTGGMASKVGAARAAAGSGTAAVVANGSRAGTLAAVLRGEEEGTFFCPSRRALGRRRRWLAFAARPRGRIEVDEGARAALVERGRSLLPSGVRAVSGPFEAGDAVSLAAAGREFARGLCNFASAELERIKGLKTSQIEAALGHKPADEVVHRDNLAVLSP